MKAIVAGLGSMGKRRIRILQSEYPNIRILGIDQREDRLVEVMTRYGIQVDNNFKGAFDIFCPDIVFVCTPPLSHSNIVLYSLQNNAHTFSEINLSTSKYREIINTSQKKGKVAFLSSTFLYRKEIIWLLSKINGKKGFSYRYHVGQYLPDWHPWEKYQNFFVFDKQTNACRELMAIEFPWIIKAFGGVKEFHVIKNKHSFLKIDYPDTIHMVFKHENGNMGSISIDCITRKATRSLEVYSEDFYWQWNGTPDSLREYSIEASQMSTIYDSEQIISNNRYSDNIIENPYIEEVHDFLKSVMDSSHSSKYNYIDDLYALALIDNIEKY